MRELIGSCPDPSLRQRQFSLLAFLVLLGASPGSAGTFTAFGPQNYVRDTGKPVTVTNNFSVLNPNTEYSIQVKNDGVASAVISVNDTEVLGPDDFDENVTSITVPVQLNTSNTIAVELRGKPGGSLTLQIIGIDNNPPVIVASAIPPPNSNGWNNSDVTVSFTCTDATSGVAVCPSPIVVTNEGAGQVITGTAVNRAGNSATASVTINLDKTPPSIAAAGSPPANAAGWNNSDVTVTFTCSDPLSGIQSCSPPVQVSTEGRSQVITGTATDKAGNSATASVTINLDKTPPTVAITSPEPGAVVNTSALTLTGTATDALSGIATVTCNGIPARVTSSSFTCDLTLNLGPNSILVQATDIAGNRGSATTSVTFAPPPVLQSVNPNTGQQGQTLSVTLTGQFTHFVQGTTQASFGAGIAVGGAAAGGFGPVTVTSSTSATAQLVIDAAAAVGTRTVSVQTGAEQASLANGFTVQAGTPVLISVVPSSGQQGQTLAVTITGKFTSFVGGTTQASFGAGIAVGGAPAGAFGPVTVTSRTSATAQLVIDAAAAVGSRTVSVKTGAEQESLTDGFTVQAGTPVLISVNPNSGQQGQTHAVTITGKFTHFGAGTTQASFGAGIAVGGAPAGGSGPVTVTSPTTATAQVAIDASATTGPRTVTLKTGAEQVSLVNGFTVNAAPAVLISVAPASGQQGQSLAVTITGKFTHFGAGATQASFGAGIAVGGAPLGAFGPVTVGSPTSATAQLAIDASATTGSRTVNVKTGAEQVSLTDGFSVTAAAVRVPVVTITAPASLSLFSKSPITVSGTVDNASDKVVVNGVPASVSGTSFTAPSVPLREGTNILTATATDPSGNVGTGSVSVTLKTTPPTIRILAPSDKAILTSSTVTVAGNVNDIVTGTVNAEQVKVTVNGVEAAVSNRSFSVADLPLVQGTNTITAVAADKLGNQSQHRIQVTFQASILQQRIVMISGNNQSAVIGTKLPNPLVVQVVNLNGAPIANRQVTFTVVKSDGVLSSLSQQGQQVALVTDKNGQASVTFQLGTRVGAGNNEVSVTSPGFVGEVIFCETATPGKPDKINVVSGDNQNGVVGKPLAQPFVAIVFDSGGNPIAGVPVTFKVTQGGGKLGSADTSTVKTDGDGKAAAILTLGQQEGINNNVVVASSERLTGAPATYTASGKVGGAAAKTAVSGVVLDNANVPIPGVSVKILNTNIQEVFTNKEGRFSISGAPVGTVRLLVDGSTQKSRPETFPFLVFMLTTIAGQDNTIGMPILLPPLDMANAQTVGGDKDVVLKMKGVPGYEFTVFAHSVTKPDGTPYVGPLSLSQVHSDKVPMIPPNGTAPNIAGTLQPAGLHFNPPIKTQFPNTAGLAPGTVIDIFSFDHDLEDWASQGPGRVSADGSVIVSDPGFGITKSGWHFPPPPPPPKTCTLSCDSTNECQSLSLDAVNCVCIATNINEGGDCGGNPGVNSCKQGKCKNGSCEGVPRTSGSCDDGIFCTENDMCNAAGECVGNKIEDTADVKVSTEVDLKPILEGIEKFAMFFDLNPHFVAKFSNEFSKHTTCCEERMMKNVEISKGEFKAAVGFDSGQFLIPALSFNIRFVKIGVFVQVSGTFEGTLNANFDFCKLTHCWGGGVNLVGGASGGVKAEVGGDKVISLFGGLAAGLKLGAEADCDFLTYGLSSDDVKLIGGITFFDLVTVQFSKVLVPSTPLVAGKIALPEVK